MSDPRNITSRTDYLATGLDIDDTSPDPFEQFDTWFSEAVDAGVDQPNAMVLSTATADGEPSSRAVLMKAYNAEGFVFYTNLRSAKATDIDENPKVALLFLWIQLHRQVRIVGNADQLESTIADAYFESRPLAARIGAIASPQSQVIASREWLEQQVAAIAARETHPARPDHWGGYRVKPIRFEFWQGQPDRLHDRIQYIPGSDGWQRSRLAP